MNNTEFDTFKRVDDKHLLDLYIGKDNFSRPTLFLISNVAPPIITSSQIINVFIGQRKDNRWGVSFSLLDSQFDELFTSFCKDIIESSRTLKEKNFGPAFVCNRYEQWQRMLTKSRGELLSDSYIKGLIGELYFLKEKLIPIYGQETALNSWIGPDKADQDFVCDDLWYEIKSVVSGAESVNITCVEQLDTPKEGELIIVYLDKTSNSDKHKLTLNNLYKEIYQSMKDDRLKNKLSEILLKLNYYPRPEYDQPAFKFSKLDRYIVDENFPCIRRESLPNTVLNTTYEISIALLNKVASRK